jgi:ABC-type multidrug transport system fused ATPase/permease subunit
MKKDYSILKMYKRLAAYIIPYWYLAALVLLLTLINTLVAPFMAEINRNIFFAIEDKNMKMLILFGSLLLASVVGSMILNTIKNYITTSFSGKSILRLESDMFSHINSLPMEYFGKTHSGDVIARLTNDIGAVRGVIGGQALSLLQVPLDTIAVVVYGFFVNWQITLFVLTGALLPLISNVVFGKRLREASQELHKIWSKIYSLSNDILKGLGIVKAYNIKTPLLDKVQENFDFQLKAQVRQTKLAIVVQIGISLASNFSILVPSIIGAWLILKGEMRFGDVMAIIMIIPRINMPFQILPQIISGFQQGAAAVERVLEVLDMEEEQYGSGGMPDNYWIWFEDVSFSYDDVKALDNTNLTINKGDYVGLVGPSGCGKSTVLKMILGFYKPQTGVISLAGKDLFAYGLKEIRKSISYVPQEPYLFSATIKENILLGNPDADEQEWLRAAKICLVDEFVQELPAGYDTVVGQNGVNLSGGQRQRIGIARALLKNASILLLDEATSSLDNDTEQRLYQGLRNYPGLETVVAVAHRLSTVQYADIIYVMDKGKVVEQGVHSQLLAANGLYTQLYEGKGGDNSYVEEATNLLA